MGLGLRRTRVHPEAKPQPPRNLTSTSGSTRMGASIHTPARLACALADAAAFCTLKPAFSYPMPPSRPLGSLLLLGSLLSGLAFPALASDPAAWREYGQKVQSRCLAASSLKGAKPLGERLDMPAPAGDGLMINLLLLEGVAPQPFRKGARVRELCMYDQRSGQARVAEADALFAPRKN